MAIIVFSLIGTIPNARARIYVNDYMFKMTQRLFCRPLSAVVTFHNTQYRPRNKGFCVANHTTPMDVAILGSDCTYSLVRLKSDQTKTNKTKKSRHFAHLSPGGFVYFYTFSQHFVFFFYLFWKHMCVSNWNGGHFFFWQGQIF